MTDTPTPQPRATPTYRATHRVDTPAHPPLYCLREADALGAAEGRAASGLGTSEIWSLVPEPIFWRTVP